MKKLFSRIVITACFMTCIPNHSSELSTINSKDDIYPASIETNGNKSKTQPTNPIAQKSKLFADQMKNTCSVGANNFKNKINSITIKKSNKPSQEVQPLETEVNIIPEKTKENNGSKIKNNRFSNVGSKIKNMKNSVLPKKKEKSSKLEFKKHSLTEINETRNIKKIKEHINNEEFFKHDAKNKLYLDRFKTYGSSEEKSTFFDQKNIVENENGDIQLNMGQGKPIDQLINEIEQTNPDEPNAQPIELTLKESIGIALAKHPDILSAKLSTDIYRSRIIQAWSAYFPNISADLNWGHNYTRYHGYSFGDGYNSFYLPDVSAGMLIFDFGKTKTAVDIAQTDYDASRYDLQDSIGIIIHSIKSAYLNVLFAQKQVEVYNKTIEDFDLQLQSAQKYFSIGKKPQIDVLTAEYNAGNARLNLVKANNTLENAKVTFANTLGLPEFANFTLSDELIYNEYDIDLEDILNDAFNIRPDLLSYEKNVESSYLEVRKASRYFTPDLNANGGLSYSDIDDSNTSNYRVTVSLAYTGFNFMQLKKEYDIAKKMYKKALADYESKRQSVYLEVKQAFIDYNNAKQSVKQADLNVKQAKAQHYHATGRYKAGFGDAIEIKDAENTYLNAQLSYYQALLDYSLSLAELERVIGRPIDVQEYSSNPQSSDNNTKSSVEL